MKINTNKLNLKGKITTKHAEEIEEIIYQELRQAEYKGLMEGKRIWRKYIVEEIEKMRKCCAKYDLACEEKWAKYHQALEDIKKLNKE